MRRTGKTSWLLQGQGTFGLRLAAVLVTMLTAKASVAAEAAAEQDSPYLWKPRVTSVAVFKNGLGFFTRAGEVSLRGGWCLSKEIPPAAFGTLAIFAHSPKQMVDIVGSGPGEVVEFDDNDAPKQLAAKRARLEASSGLNVQLTYTKAGAKRTAAGRLRSVGPEFVVLESESDNFAVPVDAVQRMQVLDLPIRVHVVSEAQKPPVRATLGMAYLRKGITWIPEYTITILDEDTAEITLRGTLVNEAEDLVHCDVNFVVGVPHFVHTNYMAPIAVGQVIRTIGSAVAPAQVRTQIMSRAALASNLRTAPQFNVVEQPVPGGGGDLDSALGSLPPMAGPAGTDYTVYTKKDLTIRRGEKGIVTLFRKKIRYSHIYRWSPPARMDHFLVLHNATDTAWTTGPCLVVSKDRPLSEDLLKYVPKGGSGEMPVTAAINIAHQLKESEIERKLKEYSPSRDFYLDRVTLKGELRIKNFEARPVVLVVTTGVAGRPVSASDDGSLTVDTKKLKLLERSGSIRWQTELQPGETRILTYTYERYVPSR